MSSPDDLRAAAASICAIATNQALYRASINRLYYASYHRCYAYHSALPRLGSVGTAKGRHEQLISQLANPDAKLPTAEKFKSAALGKELRLACGKRVVADYKCDVPVDACDMQISLQATDIIFSNT